MGAPAPPFYKHYLNYCNSSTVWAKEKIQMISERRENEEILRLLRYVTGIHVVQSQGTTDTREGCVATLAGWSDFCNSYTCEKKCQENL